MNYRDGRWNYHANQLAAENDFIEGGLLIESFDQRWEGLRG